MREGEKPKDSGEEMVRIEAVMLKRRKRAVVIYSERERDRARPVGPSRCVNVVDKV